MSDPLLPCTTSLVALLQRLDEMVPPAASSIGGRASAPSAATVVCQPPPEPQSRVLVELLSEIAAHSAQRLCEAFPGLGTQPRTVDDVANTRDGVQSAKRWLAHLSEANHAAATPSGGDSAPAPVPHKPTGTSKDRRRRRPPREMAASAIVVELAINQADIVLAIIRHASDASLSPASPISNHPPSMQRGEDASLLSSCVASPTVDGDDVMFLDSFDALLPLETAVVAPPRAEVGASSTTRTTKRSRDGDLPHSLKAVEGILERQDHLVTWLSNRLYSSVAQDDVVVSVDTAAMCLCRPLVQLLGFAVHVCGGGDKLCAMIVRAAEEMRDQHDLTILTTVAARTSPVQQSESVTLFPVTDRSMSLPWSRNSGEAHEDSSGGAASRPWGSGRRSPHLITPCCGDDSQRSASMGTHCGYTAEGDRFSIPPPMVRTVSDVVRRTAPQLATHALAGREGQISPPRSPLFPTPSAHNRPSAGSSPTAPSPSLAMPPGSVHTAPRRLMGGQRTPATVPKRSTELPSYMLTKRRGPQKPRPPAPEQRLTSALLPSPETTLQRQPPLLVLGAGTPPTKHDAQRQDWPEAPLPEDRMLFADDD